MRLGGKTICCIIVCSALLYYYSLNAQAKARYEEKLKLAGLSLEKDTYDERNANSYKDNMTAWPILEYGHIFTYFIRRPGLYTQEKLLSWKQLEAYNYFQNGYVRLVQVYKLKTGSYLCSEVVSEPQPAFHAYAVLNLIDTSAFEDGMLQAHYHVTLSYLVHMTSKRF